MQVIGIGTAVVTPLVGNLSDHCGRKALLTLPLTAAIFPLGKILSHRLMMMVNYGQKDRSLCFFHLSGLLVINLIFFVRVPYFT